MLARNEPRKRMRKVGMRKVGRWIDAGMCNATVNQFGLGLGSDRREWCCRCRREWFALSRLGLGAGRRREWFGSVIANGSDRREWFRPPSRMVQTIVANGSDCRPSSRMVQTAVRRCEWFGAVANGSDHRPEWFRPSSRMVQSRREWFRPSRIVIGDYRSYRRRWGSPVTGFGSEATGFGFQKNKNWMMIF